MKHKVLVAPVKCHLVRSRLVNGLSVAGLLVASTLASCLQQPSDSVDAPAKSAPAGAGTTSRKSDAVKPTERPTSRPSKVEATPSGSGAGVVAGTRLDETAYEHFGDGIAAAGKTIDLAELTKSAEDLEGKKVRLAGTVQSVCKKKGCWMYVAEGEQKIFVRFRDYGFFVPKDCEGREAILEGTFSVTETSVADQKHYLEDEGKHDEAKKITEPKIEMKVMADGVALRKEQSKK